jgi:hypothetical protein
VGAWTNQHDAGSEWCRSAAADGNEVSDQACSQHADQSTGVHVLATGEKISYYKYLELD